MTKIADSYFRDIDSPIGIVSLTRIKMMSSTSVLWKWTHTAITLVGRKYYPEFYIYEKTIFFLLSSGCHMRCAIVGENRINNWKMWNLIFVYFNDFQANKLLWNSNEIIADSLTSIIIRNDIIIDHLENIISIDYLENIIIIDYLENIIIIDHL